jgi:hypothetical protein
MAEGVKVLDPNELEHVRRRLADIGPWDDATRLLATLDAERGRGQRFLDACYREVERLSRVRMPDGSRFCESELAHLVKTARDRARGTREDEEMMCSGAPGCVCRACYPSGWEADDIPPTGGFHDSRDHTLDLLAEACRKRDLPEVKRLAAVTLTWR